MANDTKIEWTDATWNPTVGCTPVSAGCARCYAVVAAARCQAAGADGYEGVVEDGRWTGRVNDVVEKRDLPFTWRKPRRVFVDSMSDLFHAAVEEDMLEQVWYVMRHTPHHTYQVLTKRPERMRDWATRQGEPLPNVWLGVSLENQATADVRIPPLLDTPAAVRFVSAEPLLGPVLHLTAPYIPDVRAVELRDGRWERDGLPFDPPHLDWVIVGGESGLAARPCQESWVRMILEEAAHDGVPVFVKQMGTHWAKEHHALGVDGRRDLKGSFMSNWPEDLWVREWPANMRGNGQ